MNTAREQRRAAEKGTPQIIAIEQVDQTWTYDDIAHFYQVTYGTVRNWASQGKLPRPLPGLGKTKRFDPNTVRRHAGVQVLGDLVAKNEKVS
ncbi:hypothetical protein ACFOYW_04495 [Gryllotalpicola reticulitermitis]|uniref:Helix-turn-helix domain-containing protein n=1 Tax=Gryllotalpicola reticulitermitis TaxID=1184153 RepID=A0ABV8Q4T4_9MICO